MYQVTVANKVFFSEDYDWSLAKTLAAARKWAAQHAPTAPVTYHTITCL